MRQLVIGVALCALLAWGVLRDRPAEPPPAPVEFFALGTLIQINSVTPLASDLVTQLQNALNRFEDDWSVLGDGLLAQTNAQLQDQTQAPLPDRLQAGAALAQKACLASNGLFDPGLGGLVALWGFDEESHFRDTPPSRAAIASTPMRSLCHAGLGDTIDFDQSGAQLNFGASAKGQAVDELAFLLRQGGVENFIVNAGGDLKALGRKPDRAWRIGIRHPRPNQQQRLLATLEVNSGEAVFSSGDYERYFEYQGRRYHHILDPRTGMPAGNSQSATVVHPDAAWADAASTALFVAGPSLASVIMDKMDITLWLLVDQQGEIHASEAMRARLDDLEPS